jgi:hypothetical protein
MTRGDAASQCAAIYSIMEPSLLGQTLELLIMWNPIDESEDEIASRVRLFHHLADEYYQMAGEPDTFATYLADYSIVELIHTFHEIKNSSNDFETYSAELVKNCDTTLAGIRRDLQQQ